MINSQFKEVAGDETLNKLLKILNYFKHSKVIIEKNEDGQRQATIYVIDIALKDMTKFNLYIENDTIFVTHNYNDKMSMLLKLRYDEKHIDAISYYLSEFLHSAKYLKEIYEAAEKEEE